MRKITITEALSDIKLIGKQIEKKREYIDMYLVRQELIRDPLESSGGSLESVARAEQSIVDLTENIVLIRSAIQASNLQTTLVIDGESRSVTAWLNWRRECSAILKAFYNACRAKIIMVRDQTMKRGGATTFAGAEARTAEPNNANFVINMDEQKLAQKIEHMETVLGKLDGALSLNNATVTIDVN